MFHDQFMSPPDKNVLHYASHFRERLYVANTLAKQSLSGSHEVMKRDFDRSAVTRCFRPGDLVLPLLYTPVSVRSSKFTGPYEVRERQSDTAYIVNTPESRRKTCVCHIYMLKLYQHRESDRNRPKPLLTILPLQSATLIVTDPALTTVICGRLIHSSYLVHLPD